MTKYKVYVLLPYLLTSLFFGYSFGVSVHPFSFVFHMFRLPLWTPPLNGTPSKSLSGKGQDSRSSRHRKVLLTSKLCCLRWVRFEDPTVKLFIGQMILFIRQHYVLYNHLGTLSTPVQNDESSFIRPVITSTLQDWKIWPSRLKIDGQS